MPWCPICRNEYREGIKFCADCGSELVETLREPVLALGFGTLEEMEPLREFLTAGGFESIVLRKAQEDGIYELFAGEKEKEKAERAVRLFYQERKRSGKTAGAVEEVEKPEEKTGIGEQSVTVYQKSSERAEEFKSSAYVLLGVGVIGLTALALTLAGIIPLHLAGMNKYLIGGVMGALFVLFIVMGAFSLKSSRLLQTKAKKEDELTKELLSWCRENLTREIVDAEAFPQDVAEMEEEAKYFRRFAYMKERVTKQFMNLDDAYLEQLLDDYYQEAFPSLADAGQV